jgi:hypothetical protein
MPCHSSARRFGIAAATWTAAMVPIGLAMQCGASEMPPTLAERWSRGGDDRRP